MIPSERGGADKIDPPERPATGRTRWRDKGRGVALDVQL